MPAFPCPNVNFFFPAMAFKYYLALEFLIKVIIFLLARKVLTRIN
jgi:hypothetical protein